VADNNSFVDNVTYITWLYYIVFEESSQDKDKTWNLTKTKSADREEHVIILYSTNKSLTRVNITNVFDRVIILRIILNHSTTFTW